MKPSSWTVRLDAPRAPTRRFIGAFDAIKISLRDRRSLDRDFASGHFSFNSKAGQCQHCKGVGFEKIEMQFLVCLHSMPGATVAAIAQCWRSLSRKPQGGPSSKWSIADLWSHRG